MTEKVRRELLDIPVSYPAYSLRETFYHLLAPEEREVMADRLLHFVRPLRMACENLTEDQMARLLYETLSASLIYDDTPYPSGEGLLRYTYAGGISTGRAVCMGIAELYTLLGTALGLKVRTIIGYADDPDGEGGLHAWNQVQLKDRDGQYKSYHLDLTWDLGEHEWRRGFCYYLKSDAYMEAHHHIWLKERYWPCPSDRPCSQIPGIRPAAVRLLCRQFKNMRQDLALHQ